MTQIYINTLLDEYNLQYKSYKQQNKNINHVI